MALDMSKYKAPVAKKLPVVLLLDVSGSMIGEKIDTLHVAVVNMIETLAQEEQREQEFSIAIITFGQEINLHTRYSSATTLLKNGIAPFNASGQTPLGVALTMAKDMLEDKDETPSNTYCPVAVLVSDGKPNNGWQKPMEDFIKDGRSSKCQRFAVAIGEDVNIEVLEEFTGNSDLVYYAENAKDICDKFQIISRSVSVMVPSKATPKAIVKEQVEISENSQNTVKVNRVEEDDDDYDLY